MKKYALPVYIIFIIISIAVVCICCNARLQAQPTSATITDVTDLQNDEAGARIAEETQVFIEIQQPASPSFAADVTDLTAAQADAICEEYDAVGVQCAVIEDGFVTGSYVYGMADVENDRAVTQNTKYRVASLSKLFTDMVFMRLADDGITDPDADISEYYGFTVRNPSYPDTPITTRMLMTHTASISDGAAFDRAIESHSEMPIARLLQDRSSFYSAAPGTGHAYSNLSNALVGSVSELASRRCFEDLAQEFFLQPLGIDGSYLASEIDNAEDIGLLYGDSSTLQSQLLAQFNPSLGQTVHLVQGNLTISATDYAQLICVLLNGGCAADGKRLLSEESVAQFLQVQFSNGSEKVGFGSFIYTDVISGRTLFVHTGSAYGMYACYAFEPIEKDGVVVLTSGARYASEPQTGIYSICLELIRAWMPVN